MVLARKKNIDRMLKMNVKNIKIPCSILNTQVNINTIELITLIFVLKALYIFITNIYTHEKVVLFSGV